MQRVEQLYHLAIINNVITLTGLWVVVMVTHSSASLKFFVSHCFALIHHFMSFYGTALIVDNLQEFVLFQPPVW